VLGVSLDSAQSRTSLHVAVLAQAAAREPDREHGQRFEAAPGWT
jgi:hypothetical protein